MVVGLSHVPGAMSAPVASEIARYGEFEAAKLQGDRFVLRREYKKAIVLYEKALQIQTGTTELYYNLAIAHYGLRHIKETVETLEALIAIDGTDVEAHYNLGCLNLYLEDVGKSHYHFDKAKEASPAGSAWTPLIERALDFMRDFEKSDRNHQELAFFLLHHGPAPVNFQTTAN